MHTIVTYVSITTIGPAGTNYTLSHNRMYLSNGVKYLHSAPYIIKPINCLLPSDIFKAIAHWYIELWAIKVRKVGNFYVPTCPIFTGPVKFALFTFFSLIIVKMFVSV